MNWTDFRQVRKTLGRPFIIAHRGVPVAQPENTLPSFDLAIQQGADVLETDLRFSRDNEIVLFHDATLERMTDGRGPVGAYTVEELKRLHTRAPDGSWTTASIPTLLELIEHTRGQTPLLLELKDPRFAQRQDAERLVRLLDAFGMVQRSAVISFHAHYVATVKAICPEIPTGKITLKNTLPTGNVELLGPLWPLLYLNPLYVAWAHRLGKVVAPLDPKPEPRVGYYLRLEVDALLADHPARVLQAIRQQKRKP